MTKVFTLTIEVRETDSPQRFTFTPGFNGLEILGIWDIVENLAKEQKQIMLRPVPPPVDYKPSNTSS